VTASPTTEEISPARAALLLALATAIGAVARAAGLGQELWIDELATLELARGTDLARPLGAYTTANNHLLNTVLVAACVRLFGDAEWSVRLPAFLFGVAAIPALFWAARRARCGRPAALGAAFLLATSYHHAWFSQSARGYTGFLFFSLLAVAALARLVEAPGPRWLTLFVVASTLNTLALLPGVFVLAAQAAGAVGAVALDRRRLRAPAAPWVAAGLALAAAATAAALAPLARGVVRVLEHDAPRQVTAFRLSSWGFAREVVRGGLPDASPVGLFVAGAAGLAGLWGIARLLRRAPWVGGPLLGANALLGLAALAFGWRVYPRMFALLLPVGILGLVVLFERPWRRLAPWPRLERRAPLVVAAALALVAAAWLPRLVRVPKQPYRAAVAEAARRSGESGLILAVGVADRGVVHYAGRLPETARVGTARTLAAFDEQVGGARGPVVLVSTFDRALAIESPELWARMRQRWRPVARFAGSVRGGELTVWAPVETAAPPQPAAGAGGAQPVAAAARTRSQAVATASVSAAAIGGGPPSRAAA